MPFTAPRIAEVRMFYRDADSSAENVYHVHNETADWTLDALVSLIAVFTSWESDTASSHRSADTHCYRVTATDLTSLDSPRTDGPAGLDIAGAFDTPGLPYNATIAIKFLTGKRGRGRQGRTYWIGTPEGVVDESHIIGSYHTALIDALTTLRDNISAVGDIGLVVLHRQLDGVALDVGTRDSVEGFALTDDFMDSQRGRLPNHRRRRRHSGTTGPPV